MEITSQEISEAWQVLCSVYDSRGIDLQELLNEAARSQSEWLSNWRYKEHFEKLRKAGCGEKALRLALWIVHSAPSWSNTWRVVVGKKRQRNQIISALGKAASALEHLENSFGASLSRDKRQGSHEAVSAKANTVDAAPRFTEAEPLGVPAPLALIRALRMYARVLKGFDDVAKRTRINSPEAFGRYLISSFVKTATGEYYDKEVSALIGGALGETYDERAHCVWRSRNYKHLEAVSFPVELLVSIGTYLALNA